MAVDYSIPSFLNRPTDTAEPMLQGLQLGAHIAQEQNRLQQQAQIATMEATARAEESQRRAAREQQEIAMQKAMNEAQMGLRKQALDQSQQEITLKTQQLARKYAAQQRFNAAVAAGEDPAKALLSGAADLQVPLTGAAALYKASMPKPPLPDATMEAIGGHSFLKVPRPSGGFDYKNVKDDVTAGPIQGQPVMDPSGKAVPGLIGVPSATGGYTVHNIPNVNQQIAKARIAAIEKGPFGDAILNDASPRKRDTETKEAYQARLKKFEDTKAQYEKYQRMLEGAVETPRGTVKGSKTFRDKTNRVWTYTGDHEDPRTDKNPDNWE